jgi:hypothetical protein
MWRVQAALVAVGVLVGLGAVVVGRSPSDALTAFVFFSIVFPVILLSCIAVMVPAVAVHELGHVLAGRRAGFKLLLLVVGPFGWRIVRDRLKFYWVKPVVMGGLAGMVPGGKDDLRRRMAVFIGGGPLASLLYVLLLLAILHLTGINLSVFGIGAEHPRHEGLQSYLSISVVIGAFIFVSSIMPSRASYVQSDGHHLWTLFKGGARAERLIALMTVQAQWAAGMRARDWSPELLQQALEPKDKSLSEANALLYSYYHHLDRGECALAWAAIDRAGELTKSLHQVYSNWKTLLQLERAFGLAWCQGDAAGARDALASAGAVPANLDGTRLRAEAAIAQAEGDLEKASQAVDAAVAFMHREVAELRDNHRAELAWLDKLRGPHPHQVASGQPDEPN